MVADHVYKTKTDIARSLPIGTWFVWPGMLPKPRKCYRPKVYCVLENHQPSRVMYIDRGCWTETTGPKAPGAAYARANLVAAALNDRQADVATARAYLKELARTCEAEVEPSTTGSEVCRCRSPIALIWPNE